MRGSRNFCQFYLVHSLFYSLKRGKRELVALLYLSSWCLVMVERLFLAVPWGCLRFVIVVFPDHTHLLFSNGFIAEKSILILYQGSRGGPLYSGGGGCPTFSSGGGSKCLFL